MSNNKLAQIFHFDLQGKREEKYSFLNENSLASIAWNTLEPNAPNFFFVKKDNTGVEEYEKGFKVDELFALNNSGIATEFDDFVIRANKKECLNQIDDLKRNNEEEIIKKYNLPIKSRTKVSNSKMDLIKSNDYKIVSISYRPFDNRFCIYTGKTNGLMARPRKDVMTHMLKENVGLCFSRLVVGDIDWRDIFITNKIVEKGIMAMRVSNNAPLFPLYLYPETNGQLSIETTPAPPKEGNRTPNLNTAIVNQIAERLGLTFVAEKFPSFVAEKFPSSGGVAESRGGRNTRNYMALPYNPNLKERAKELRQAGNLSEVLFWNQVKNKQFKGFDFDRQKIVGNYIVDFYCSNCNVVIEIDGSSHDDKQEYDAARDSYLESLGLTIIHIPVIDVMKNMKGVMEMLINHPALKGTPPEEGNDHPALKGTPPEEGNFAPIDILDYIYAVLHSPSYREKYKEFLKIDFPRVPYPKDKDTFWQLVALGAELRQIHLLESPIVEKYITQYPIDGDNVVTKPRFIHSPPKEGWLKAGVVHSPPLEGLGEVGKVFINDTQYFGNVPEVAWEFFIGGYQPAQKWLKDRKERTLEFEDILHYQKIIVALAQTDNIMSKINGIDIEAKKPSR